MVDKHILLVDDDEDMLMLTGRWLKKEYQTVDTVSSGRAAIDFLKGQKVDLVLLDYAMSEMDGVATLTEIRNTPEIADTRVVFLTGMEDSDSLAADLNPLGSIPKSGGKKAIMAAVAEFVG